MWTHGMGRRLGAVVTDINQAGQPHICMVQARSAVSPSVTTPPPHASGLTWLSVAGARVSNDQLFSLVLLHLPNLQHLDLSGISAFTAGSLPSLLLLPALTSLDIRSTMATADAAAVDTLVKLPNCRRLALSVAGEESYGRPQQQWRPQQQQQRQLHNSVIDEVSSSRGSTPRNSMDEGVAGGLRAYAYLRGLGRAQSLRQLLLGGSTPSLTEYVRGLLPPWVEVR